jgi:hypothetical protein
MLGRTHDYPLFCLSSPIALLFHLLSSSSTTYIVFHFLYPFVTSFAAFFLLSILNAFHFSSPSCPSHPFSLSLSIFLLVRQSQTDSNLSKPAGYTTVPHTDGVGALSSFHGTPSDDITLSTSDAIFRYEIGELKMKKFHTEYPNFDNEIITESTGENSKDEDTAHQVVQAFVTYTWKIQKPSIAHFTSENKLFLRLSAHPANVTGAKKYVLNSVNVPSPYSGHEISDKVEADNSVFRSRNVLMESGFQSNSVDSSFITDLNYLVTVEITFSPCPANSCVHGTCVVQHGDVQSSSCVCR